MSTTEDQAIGKLARLQLHRRKKVDNVVVDEDYSKEGGVRINSELERSVPLSTNKTLGSENRIESTTQERERMASQGDSYGFRKIVDAIGAANKSVVNLIGVIHEFSVPKISRGTDWFCTLKIIDESRSESGFSVTLFDESSEKLPHIKSPGDIIQLYNVVINKQDTSACAVFYKNSSSFALYEGKEGNNFLPYQVSSRFCLRDQDKKYIGGLRKWLGEDYALVDVENFMLLREIKEGDNKLICKVLHVCNVSEDEQMAFIWDGTDTPPISIHAKLEDEISNPLPLHLEPMALSKDLLCRFPAIGTILRVTIVSGSGKRLQVGRWVKFINLVCEIQSGLWCGKLTKSTKLRHLPDDDHITQDLQRSYDDRALSNWDRMSSWAFPWPSRITEVLNDDVPITTLMEVLTCPKINAVFHPVVRIVAICPWRAEDFIRHDGKYQIRLTMEDATARIHAYLLEKKEGERFFGGRPGIEELTRKRNKLLGVSDGNEVRNPPFIRCYLRSYNMTDKSGTKSKQYLVYDTKVVG